MTDLRPPLSGLGLGLGLGLALGLGLGATGGLVFKALGLPLPWMLGALFFTMAAGVAGVPVRGPARLRPALVAVIGVMLGARFTPDVLGHAAAWAGTLALLVAYLASVAAVVVPWNRHVGRMDWTTAYFAGMPGGLTEMIEIGEANGARVQPIVLAHSLRIALTVAAIALWYRLVQGTAAAGPAAAGPAWPSLSGWPSLKDWPTWDEALLLLAAALAGVALARRLRLPAPAFLGPLILSAGLHLSALSEAVPPAPLVNLAQVLLGTVLGCRFRGVPLRALRAAGGVALGAVVLSLGLAAGFAQAMQALSGVAADQALLALAPGGLTEMGLMALAIGGDVAFVALHHVVRILLIIVAAPPFFAWLRRRGAARH